MITIRGNGKGKPFKVVILDSKDDEVSKSNELPSIEECYENIIKQCFEMNSTGVEVHEVYENKFYWLSFSNKEWTKKEIVGGLRRSEKYKPFR